MGWKQYQGDVPEEEDRDVVGRSYLLRGEVVRVVARWRTGEEGVVRNVLIEYADGKKEVRPFRGLRRYDG